MTHAEARLVLTEKLQERYGLGEAKSIVKIVFEDAFDHGRAFEEAQFEAISKRLVAGEPLQYVLGFADFFGLKFKVNPAVLIPRQETEELVDWVIQYLKSAHFSQAPNLLDIGLGSGCIGISILKKFPGLQLYGIEKSEAALAVAKENADLILKTTRQSATFWAGDILDASQWAAFPSFEVIVSNPPYIPYRESHLVPEHVQAYEPGLALFVEDADPLVFYRAIADFSLERLSEGGCLFFECNEFNAPEVASLLRQKGFSPVELRKDLMGAERMVLAHRP